MIAKVDKLPDSDTKGHSALSREIKGHIVEMLSGMPPLRVASTSPKVVVAVKAGRVTDTNTRNSIVVPITFRLLQDIDDHAVFTVHSLAPDKSVIGSERNYFAPMGLDSSESLKAGKTYTGKCTVAWDFKHPEAGGNLGSLEIEVAPARK